MTSPVPQESNRTRVIPKAYTSGFTFFQESAQKDISELTAKELAILIGRWPRSSGRFVHELWRTGRMEVLYQFFTLPDEYRPEEIREKDVIFDAAVMMKTRNVSQEECFAFIHDLSCVSQNAHDNQEFGEDPLDVDIVTEKVERVMSGIVELVPKLPN